MNYNLKINLSRLTNAFTATIQGKTEKKRCICIPIDDNELFVGEKGTYLDAVVWELKNKTDKQTHMIKPSISKEKYEAMTELQRQAVPILGNLTPFQEANAVSGTVEAEQSDDLPF